MYWKKIDMHIFSLPLYNAVLMFRHYSTEIVCVHDFCMMMIRLLVLEKMLVFMLCSYNIVSTGS